jgi:hypothetical protein
MNKSHGAIMKKYVISVSILICGLFSIPAVATAAESAVPDPFQRFDANSKLTIDYRDFDSLLDTVVLNTGRSNRSKASTSRSTTGTRMKSSVNRSTVNEGNRFYFEVFGNSAQNQQTISKIQSRLESIPTAVALENFSRDEQLAYWINLYNITMLNEIIKAYPERELEDLLVGKNSVLSKKILQVAGVPLSLNDIQFTILRQNYENDPLIIYGLYQGNIGSPNIRKSAYTGKDVYADLIDNALEFVNSNRGTDSKNKRTFRVSSLYERNAMFFPDFNNDLTEHLLTYLEGEERGELQTATKIKTDIDDWTVTDLFGTTRDPGASFANSNAALNGALGGSGAASSRLTDRSVVASRYSPEVLKHLNDINQKKIEQREGTVTIEEMGQVTEEADTTEQVENGSN